MIHQMKTNEHLEGATRLARLALELQTDGGVLSCLHKLNLAEQPTAVIKAVTPNLRLLSTSKESAQEVASRIQALLSRGVLE